ncbi:aspartic peptidase domain-containing protein [Gongronella butleri]|nr:aspartic peptidase domain-containing protein [Gongronella butleri]
MKITIASLCISLLASSVNCVPVSSPIRVPVVANGHVNHAGHLLHIRTKYTKRAIEGAVPVINFDHHDMAYLGSVQVGTPPVDMAVVLDTGSSDFWVASTDCPSCDNGHRSLFHPSNSSTFEKDGRSWNITYASNATTEGYVGYDTVHLAGKQIKRQLVEVATKVTPEYDQVPSLAGVLGLGFDHLASVANMSTPMTSLITQKLIPKPLFGVLLGKNGKDGEFVFGGFDRQHIDGPLTRVPVNNTIGYWQVTANKMQVNGQDVVGSTDIVFDTGAANLLCPSALATSLAKIYNATASQAGYYTADCDTSHLPPLHIQLGGTNFEIPGESMVLGRLDPTNNASLCMSAIAAMDLPFMVAGATFMKNNYIVFDPLVPQVHIARAK